MLIWRLVELRLIILRFGVATGTIVEVVVLELRVEELELGNADEVVDELTEIVEDGALIICERKKIM